VFPTNNNPQPTILDSRILGLRRNPGNERVLADRALGKFSGCDAVDSGTRWMPGSGECSSHSRTPTAASPDPPNRDQSYSRDGAREPLIRQLFWRDEAILGTEWVQGAGMGWIASVQHPRGNRAFRPRLRSKVSV